MEGRGLERSRSQLRQTPPRGGLCVKDLYLLHRTGASPARSLARSPPAGQARVLVTWAVSSVRISTPSQAWIPWKTSFAATYGFDAAMSFGCFTRMWLCSQPHQRTTLYLVHAHAVRTLAQTTTAVPRALVRQCTRSCRARVCAGTPCQCTPVHTLRCYVHCAHCA
jgi:hypothetical protein